jgi:hypothetical protein
VGVALVGGDDDGAVGGGFAGVEGSFGFGVERPGEEIRFGDA